MWPLIDSAPSLGVCYFFVVDSVCLYVCLSRSFKSILLFCFSMESSHFWPSVVHVALHKTLFFDFWFRPTNSQNLLPKIWHKIAYMSACMADRPEMFWPTKGFSGIADSMEPHKMLRGRTLLPWQRNLGKFGIFLRKIAYKSACMPDRPDMFGPTMGADPCCHSNDICARHGV